MEGKRLAQQALQKQRVLVKKQLRKRGINAKVFIPVMKIEDDILHLNGDSYAVALYPNFDRIFIVTLKGRPDKPFPRKLKKIKVVHL